MEEKHSKGNWKVGIPGTVVTDNSEGFPPNNIDGRSDTDYYGGYLIAESILKRADAVLISASPDMKLALKYINDAYEDFIQSGDKACLEWAMKFVKESLKKATGL